MKEKTYHKRNKNNFWVSVFLVKEEILELKDNQYQTLKGYCVGMRVGESKRHNEEWFNGNDKYQHCGDSGITGNGSVENLQIVLEIILKHIKNNPKDTILVNAENDKRFRAYKWLLRYGFEIVYDFYGHENFYVKRGEDDKT